ncbi:MAG TPA: hypothetical protein VFO26_08300 [Gaiella sp.]|uniref:hypothetical protein n=1 Tax=Gaiella sp. TaxID=2663207 RepID=UPI002D7E9688|nr:hypothetical protein [Gaiella sp.]HET9287543.1 hypothetical protein [Gaiella sp.]
MLGQITIRVADRDAVVDCRADALRTCGAGGHGFFAPGLAGDTAEAVHHQPEGKHR